MFVGRAPDVCGPLHLPDPALLLEGPAGELARVERRQGLGLGVALGVGGCRRARGLLERSAGNA